MFGQIAERVRGKGVSPEAAEPFAEACEARREQILRAMAENATRAGHASLREVDWSVRVRHAHLSALADCHPSPRSPRVPQLTMGSSTITGVRDAAATVKLTLDAPAGFNRRSSTGVAAQDSFTLELSKAELDDVLTQCDEIDQVRTEEAAHCRKAPPISALCFPRTGIAA